MNALTLKGFLLVAALAGMGCGAMIAMAALVAGQPLTQALLFSLGGVPLGLMAGGCVYLVQLLAGGCVYLVQLPGEIRGLQLAPAELLPGEAVLQQTEHSLVHYKTGRPGRFWEATGGKLILTTHRLVFLAHRGQPYFYRVVIPLVEMASIEIFPTIPLIPGNLRITLAGGRYELFTFGAMFAGYADMWSAAIGEARKRQT